MKTVLLLTMAMLFVASAAFGQQGFLRAYADPDGENCNISSAAFIDIYVVHKLTLGTTRVEFQMPQPDCLIGVFESDQSNFSLIGNSRDGVIVDYGVCLSETILVLTATYDRFTSDQPLCCPIEITGNPHTASFFTTLYDCDGRSLAIGDALSTFNGDDTCPCEVTVPAEQTTWSQMKALYN